MTLLRTAAIAELRQITMDVGREGGLLSRYG
jgi:hypothetical protein